MNSRKFIIAMDRSSYRGLEVFSIVAARVDSQKVLTRYSDFFKHMRKLGSQKRTYVPKMLKIINQLVEENVIIGLKVFTRLNNAIEMVYNRKSSILACIIDDNTYQYCTTSGTKTSSYLKNIPLILLENSLSKPSKNLIKKIHRMNLTMVFLRTVIKISDNIANYTRSVFEEQLQRIPQIWKL